MPAKRGSRATIKSKHRPEGATAMTADQLRTLLVRLRASDECHILDLVDPITLLIATGPARLGAPGSALE